MNYTLIYSGGNCIKLQIKRDGSLTVTAPHGMKRSEIDEFVKSRSAWIEKHRAPILKADTSPDKIYFKGTAYPVLPSSDGVFSFDGSAFFIPKDLPADMQIKGVSELYRRAGKVFMAEKLNYWADAMHLPRPAPPKITSAKTRWGSCGGKHKNSICFSLLLMAAPVECIDYVTVHELAHTVYFNHGEEFHALVEKYIPDHKNIKKRLEGYGKLLTAQGFYNK